MHDWEPVLPDLRIPKACANRIQAALSHALAMVKSHQCPVASGSVSVSACAKASAKARGKAGISYSTLKTQPCLRQAENVETRKPEPAAASHTKHALRRGHSFRDARDTARRLRSRKTRTRDGDGQRQRQGHVGDNLGSFGYTFSRMPLTSPDTSPP